MENTIFSIIIMLLFSVIGFFIGAFLDNAFGGAILFALISGIACIIHEIDVKNQ